MNSTFENQIYVVTSFQPQNIILMHRKTHKLYKYAHIPQHQCVNPETDINADSKQSAAQNYSSQIILKCQPLCSGYIYQKQMTSLYKLIRQRSKNNIKDYFSTNQIYNTFQPVFAQLKKGLMHGFISLQNILIDSQENIRLKDPKICHYHNPIVNLIKNNKFNDYQSLGLAMLQSALLMQNQETVKMVLALNLNNLTRLLQHNYSTQFIVNVWILIHHLQDLIPFIKLQQLSQIGLEEKENKQKFKNIVSQVQKIKRQPYQKLQKYIQKEYKRNKSEKQVKQKQNKQQIEEKLTQSEKPEQKCKKDSLKLNQNKKIIVIPPLNLNMNTKNKKQEIIKNNFSTLINKKAIVYNQNSNAEQSKHLSKTKNKNEIANNISPKIFQRVSQSKQKRSEVRADERRIANSTNVKNMNKSKRFSIGEDQKSIFKRKGKTIDRNANVK